MRRLLLAVILAWSMLAEAEQALVLAGFLSGNGLMNVCDGTKSGELNANVSDYNSCVSYVEGVADAETVFVGWGNKQPDFCIPVDTTDDQLRLVALRYMKERPEQWQLAASSLVINAFVEAWPCPRTTAEISHYEAAQSCLAFLHYYNGAIDGIWGESSQAASEVARKAYGGTDGGFMKACEGRGWTPPE